MAKRGGHEEEMIKLEHVVLASPEQMEFIIEGMRNPRIAGRRAIVIVKLNTNHGTICQVVNMR